MTRSVLPPGLAALTGAAALAMSTVATTGADEQRPAPTACAGVAVTDPAGDSHTTTVSGGFGPGQANLDIQRVFFRYAPAPDGKNVLTANIEVTKLDATLPPGAQSIAWDIGFTLGDVTRYAKARVGADGQAVFDYGTRDGSALTSEEVTTGRLYPGDKGIVEIVLPAEKLQLADKTLADVYATAGYVGGPGPSVTVFQDRAPDGAAYGKSFKVSPCAEAGTPTPVQPTRPSGEPPRLGEPQNPPPSGALNLKVLAGKLSARKIQKKRALTVRLQAGERLRNVKVGLLKGSMPLGTVNLANFGPGRATARIKLSSKSARKIKRGTYTLSFTAKKADSAAGSGSVRLPIQE